MAATSVKITYFPLHGRGETTRLALAIAGVEVEDERVAFDDWKNLKANTPWGSMPMLTLGDGTVLCQARAIARYAAKLGGIYPEDAVLAAHCDAIMDVCEDIGSAISKVPKANRVEEATEKDGIISCWMQRMENFITEVGTEGRAVGDQLTIADVALTVYVSNWVSNSVFDDMPAEMDKQFPRIRAVREATMADARVAAYYNAKKADYTGDGPLAKAYKNFVLWQ